MFVDIFVWLVSLLFVWQANFVIFTISDIIKDTYVTLDELGDYNVEKLYD